MFVCVINTETLNKTLMSGMDTSWLKGADKWKLESKIQAVSSAASECSSTESRKCHHF